ncbi:MAG TPA: PQQ-binding-like beta-propeller repeat protein, partial [Candidatus Binatia bacterium]|nr:PQQ-binding-like beta-propeller repeat protein [Candidatus Binatia bacterium]
LTLIPQCPQCLFANPPCEVAQGTNCFQIGPDNQATAYIRDNDSAPTNHPPFVQLNAPQSGDTFTAPANITLRAYAQDAEDGYTLTVEFFEGTRSLGFGTFVGARCAIPYCPYYELTWSNVPPGEYTLTAKATDSAGATSISNPARITVREANPPPGAKLWEFSHGIVYNDPAVWRDGTIYVPQGNNVVNLYALTPNGEVKWAQVLAGGGSSPAIADDGTIYVARADGQFTFSAYSPAGNVLWSIPLHVSGTFQGFASPAIAHDGTIYVAADGSLDKGLHALRPDGTRKWRFVPTGARVLTPVVGTDGTIYFGVLNDGLYAVNPDGTLRWQLPMTGEHIWAAVGRDGTIYVTGSTSPTKLFAFTPAGVKQWETQIGPAISQHASAPVIGLDGSIFVVADQLYAFNADGSAKWAFDTPGNAWSSLRAPAIDSEGNIYAGLGDFVAVSPSGSLLWSFAANATTSPTLTPDGKIYVGAGDTLYALQANAGLAQSPWPMFQRDPRHTGAAPLITTTRPAVNIVARDPIAVEGPFCFSNWWWTTSWNSGGWVTSAGLVDPNRCPGTNTATFVVRRSGPTNTDLTVSYGIGGTASNGVDYAALSGSVTIPAGKRSAQIVITPRDDTIVEGLETVVLRLQSSPDYTIGTPARAAALIVDNDRPRPPCRLLSDRQFHFCNPATNGYCYRIEASTDLVNWTSVCTNIVTDGALHFIDPDAPPINARFYRALPEPALPPDD